MPNLVHPDTLSPRVPRLDLEFINALQPDPPSRLPPILQAQVLDRLHHMLPPGRTVPIRCKNTRIPLEKCILFIYSLSLSWWFPRDFPGSQKLRTYYILISSRRTSIIPTQSRYSTRTPRLSLQFISTFSDTSAHQFLKTFDLMLPGTTFSKIEITGFWGPQTNKDFKSREHSIIQPLRKSSVHSLSRPPHTGTTTVLCRIGPWRLSRSLWPSDEKIDGHGCNDVKEVVRQGGVKRAVLTFGLDPDPRAVHVATWISKGWSDSWQGTTYAGWVNC